MKSGNLNFLEPSGPLQAGNGTVYLYLLPLVYFRYRFHYTDAAVLWFANFSTISDIFFSIQKQTEKERK
jgi:hypothetical protein